MLRSLVLVCVLVAVVASGCGFSGGSGRDQALLASVMRGMTTDLSSVSIEQGTADRRSVARPGKYTLVVRSAATTTAGQLLDDWYGELIAAGYNQQCIAKADHCLAWYDTGHEFGWAGCCKARRPFATRAYLARRIRAALAPVGLRAASISFEHPNAFATVVTIRTRHPQQAVYALDKARGMPGRRHSAGFFIRMLDAHGQVFAVEAGAIHGEGWVRRGLRYPGVPIEAGTSAEGPTDLSPQGPQGPTGATEP